MQNGVAVNNAGAVGGDVFGGHNVFGEDVSDERGVDGEGDDCGVGCLLCDSCGGFGDAEERIRALAVTAGDTGAERVGSVRLRCVVVVTVAVAVAVVMVVVVVMVVRRRQRQRRRRRRRGGFSTGNAGLLLQGLNAAGVQSAGRRGASDLDAGVWEQLDERGEVLLGALGRAGQRDDNGAVADTSDGASHHGDCGGQCSQYGSVWGGRGEESGQSGQSGGGGGVSYRA